MQLFGNKIQTQWEVAGVEHKTTCKLYTPNNVEENHDTQDTKNGNDIGHGTHDGNAGMGSNGLFKHEQ